MARVEIVAIPGYPLDARMWGPLAKLAAEGAMGDGVAFHAPDLRGRGTSKREAGSVHTMALLADDVAEEILERSPGETPLVVVALSMGGYVVLELLRRHADRLGGRLAGVVLCDTRASADDAAGRARRHEAAEAIRKHGMQAALDAMLPKLLAPSARGGAVEALVTSMILETPPGTACADLLGMAERNEAFDVLGALTVPLLCVVGEEDAITPPADAEAMANAAVRSKSARVLKVAGAGHMAPLERPETVAAGLAELIGSLG